MLPAPSLARPSLSRHGALLAGALLAIRRRLVRRIQLQRGSESDSELLADVQLTDDLNPVAGLATTRMRLDLGRNLLRLVPVQRRSVGRC